MGPSRSHTHSFHEGGAASRVIRKVSREGVLILFSLTPKNSRWVSMGVVGTLITLWSVEADFEVLSGSVLVVYVGCWI